MTGVTASDKVYDGTTTAKIDASAAVLQGVQPGDVVTLNSSAASGTFSSKNVGTGITVQIAGLTLAGADAGNYTLTQPTTTANITAATPTFSTVLPTVPSPAPFAGGEYAVVEGLYRNILGRDADPAGLTYWNAQLKPGESAAPVAGQFFQSPEYTTNVVESYYKTYLGRDGDQAGVATWVAKLQAGASEEEVAAAFLSSPEYSAKHVTDGDFVQSLYENILGREGDPAGINNWTQLLGAGTSRGVVAASFIGSPESSQRAIDGDYNAFLARVGDTSGVNSWVAQVQNGSLTLAEVAAMFAGSPEYATRASQVTAALAITSAGSTTFTTGTLGTFTVTTTGTPTAALSETGTLPTGVTFVDNKDGTATLASTAATPAGSTTLTITAANGVGSPVTQSFTLTVAAVPAPAITSAGSTTFTTGTLGTFTVTTTGTPTAALSEAGTLPTGVTFVDNKDGTATLASTAATPAGSTTLTITAANGVGSPVTQSFTLTVAAVPAPAITSAGSTTFTTGTLGTFTVTTTGTPTAALSEAGTLPTGVTFVDNKDGTATLASTAATPAGSTTLTITASNGVGSPVTQSFTLTVAAAAAPSITGIGPVINGPAAGGTTLEIDGTNFTGATAVMFGTVPAKSYTVTFPGVITAVSPAGTAGDTVNITVTTPGGTSPVVLAASFLYV